MHCFGAEERQLFNNSLHFLFEPFSSFACGYLPHILCIPILLWLLIFLHFSLALCVYSATFFSSFYFSFVSLPRIIYFYLRNVSPTTYIKLPKTSNYFINVCRSVGLSQRKARSRCKGEVKLNRKLQTLFFEVIPKKRLE